jgi:hypothetical protein
MKKRIVNKYFNQIKKGRKKCQAENKDRQERDGLPIRTQERHFP